MKLRIISAILWFLAGWVTMGPIVVIFGLNQAAGPLVGLAWAAFVVADPKRLIWQKAGLAPSEPVRGGSSPFHVGAGS
jgi:hypothetical protein